MNWIPLHVHSQFSILDSTASIKELVQKAVQYHMPALALTDQGNLHGAVDFFKACKDANIQPIIGCELFVAPGSRLEKKRVIGQKPGYAVVLLAKNKKGYQNLCKLSSSAYLEGFYYTPRIDKELLQTHGEGLVCLVGSMRSKLCELICDSNLTELAEEIAFFQNLFQEDLYFEVASHKMSEAQMQQDGMDQEPWLWQASLEYQSKQEKVCQKLLALAEEKKIGVVATNECRYIHRKDFKAHEILANISSGEPCVIWEKDSQGNAKNKISNPKRKVQLSHELYFKSQEEMGKLFEKTPHVLLETQAIAQKCQFSFDFTSKFYPVFVPPHLEGVKLLPKERELAAESFLKQLCEEGIKRRYKEATLAKVAEKYPYKNPMEVVYERFLYEIELITSKGLCDYLLIVYDFISWAKQKNIPMGPGRGSGVGSIVCYLTGITDIEPLRFNLFFERFINPERVSYPDIDVDICMERRAEVIEYTVSKYGKDNVAQIITFGTMKAKMAIKDVGRVLSVPLTKVNAIAKLIPDDLDMTLEKALEMDRELANQYETDEETKKLIDLAKILEGSVRNTGIHAAGLIISAEPLMQHIPVCNAKDESIVVTQYAMKPVEAVGMLKIDFLGLKTLTSIQLAVDAVEESCKIKIDWSNLNLEDKATFALLNQGKNLGLFQLESTGMQKLSKELHIDKFEEIIAVGALYRPGPMEMIPSFINRKHGREKIEFDHPLMKDILEETYGVMVYQEQVMMMAQKLAGYSLGAGDVLRKAMGKKDREEMARQRENFRQGAKANGIDERVSMEIFDKIEKFASYGFNKSHAAAYGYLSYVTAYLKANYPLHWMAALMTSDRDDLSKVTKIIRECQAMNIAILPPDVNESSQVFVATAKGIRFALTAIKGVGQGVVEAITQERKAKGAFLSLYDFIKRIDTEKIGKKTIEYLIEAGAFDFTTWHRLQLKENVEPIYQIFQKEQKEHKKGELNFFSLIETEDTQFQTPPPIAPPSKMSVLRKEKELLGFYLTGHPLDEVQDLLQKLSCVHFDQFENLEHGAVIRTGFVLESVTTKFTNKSGRKFAVVTIGDYKSCLELVIWPDLYEEKGYLLVENQLIYAILQIEKEDGQIKLQCRWLEEMTKVNEAMIQECDLAYDKARMQSKLNHIRKKTPKVEKEIVKENYKEQILKVKINVQKMRLSHVLQLKEIFRKNAGKSKVEVEFLLNQKLFGKIMIDPTWGVEISSELKNHLTSHPAVIDILVESKVES